MRRDGGAVARIEFCTRATSAVPERRDSILALLRGLETEGRIAGLSAVTWPAEVEFGSGHEALERFAAFEAWGDHAGATVRPPFQVRTRRSLVDEPERDVLVTPELCLAAYEGDEIVAVRPCEHDGSVETIDAYLTALDPRRRTTADDQTPDPPAR